MIRKETKEPEPEIANGAATLIQKIWRGYYMRRKIKQRKLEEMSLIGKYDIFSQKDDFIKFGSLIEIRNFSFIERRKKKFWSFETL